MRLISREETLNHFTQDLSEEDRAYIRLRSDVYELLTLIPAGADLLKLESEFTVDSVLGFYDPEIETLFVLDDLGEGSLQARLTLVHEIVHALQDQHYGLLALADEFEADWDRSMALSSVIEGDAEGTEAVFAFPRLAGDEEYFCDQASFEVDRSSYVPITLQRELFAQYLDGACFIQSIAGLLPEGVSSIWKALPRTMEQVLHPEKYLAGEEAVAVELRDIQVGLGGNWRMAAGGNLGEFGMQNLLYQGVTDREAVARAAAGWGGDRWNLYREGTGGRLLHLEVVWDSEAEAREFWDVFKRSVNVATRGAVSPGASQTYVAWDTGGKAFRAMFSGAKVVLVAANDRGAAEAAARSLGLR